MSERVRVLIAEDERMFLVGYQDYLEDEGFQVIPVSEAQGLLESASTAQVLVVDARLPTEQLEGIEAVTLMLREGKLPDAVPVIFISVLPRDEPLCKHKLDELPIPDDRYVWLQKPFELELLSNTIRGELGKRGR